MEPATILWLIGFLVICLLGSIVCLLVYSGLLEGIEIRAGPPKFGALTIAYKYAQGDYKNAGQLFTEVHNFAPMLKTIGLYYDDPSEVAPCDLRYAVGAIIAESDVDGDGDVYAAKAPDLGEAKLLIEKGYKLVKLPSVSHAVTAQFPFKNTMSVVVAVARVYPKMSKYIKERNLCAHPMIEVYDNDAIHFVAPLAKQDEFYVPEAIPFNEHEDDDNAGTEPEKGVENESKRSDSNASDTGESSSSFEELNPEAEK